MIKISPLPKYRALNLKVCIHQILVPLKCCALALKGLVNKILSLYIHWRRYINGKSDFVFPPVRALLILGQHVLYYKPVIYFLFYF